MQCGIIVWVKGSKVSSVLQHIEDFVTATAVMSKPGKNKLKLTIAPTSSTPEPAQPWVKGWFLLFYFYFRAQIRID